MDHQLEGRGRPGAGRAQRARLAEHQLLPERGHPAGRALGGCRSPARPHPAGARRGRPAAAAELHLRTERRPRVELGLARRAHHAGRLHGLADLGLWRVLRHGGALHGQHPGGPVQRPPVELQWQPQPAPGQRPVPHRWQLRAVQRGPGGRQRLGRLRDLLQQQHGSGRSGRPGTRLRPGHLDPQHQRQLHPDHGVRNGQRLGEPDPADPRGPVREQRRHRGRLRDRHHGRQFGLARDPRAERPRHRRPHARRLRQRWREQLGDPDHPRGLPGGDQQPPGGLRRLVQQHRLRHAGRPRAEPGLLLAGGGAGRGLPGPQHPGRRPGLLHLRRGAGRHGGPLRAPRRRRCRHRRVPLRLERLQRHGR